MLARESWTKTPKMWMLYFSCTIPIFPAFAPKWLGKPKNP